MKRTFLILIVTLLVFTGCQGEKLPEGMPKLVLTSIQLTQDGEPLAGATVSLIDSAGGTQWFPGGLSDSSGIAELHTNGRYKGAPEGKYKVVVTKRETDPSKLGPAPDENDPKYVEYVNQSAREKLDTYTLVESKFNDVKRTPLEIEIKKGGGVQKLEVGAKVRNKIS